MGLLDDAIREHLELKRRHGADPAEVAQLEREAFGPAPATPAPLELPERDAEELADPALAEPEVEPPPPAPASVDEAPTRIEPLPPTAGEEREALEWDDAPPLDEDPQSTRAFDASEIAEAHGRHAAGGEDVHETAEHEGRPRPDLEP